GSQLFRMAFRSLGDIYKVFILAMNRIQTAAASQCGVLQFSALGPEDAVADPNAICTPDYWLQHILMVEIHRSAYRDAADQPALGLSMSLIAAPLLRYDCIRLARRWQTYAARILVLACLLGAMIAVWWLEERRAAQMQANGMFMVT